MGEDFVGGAGKARREPLEGGANGVADGDFFHGRSETGAGGWGDDGGMEWGDSRRRVGERRRGVG